MSDTIAKSCYSNEVGAIQSVLDAYPRAHGYYIFRVVDLVERDGSPFTEDELDDLYESFDDKRWAPKEARPKDQPWSSYEASRSEAQHELVTALVGGNAVGHTDDTISPDVAEATWAMFDQLFAGDRTYYVGLGLGNSEYVIQSGVAIVSPSRAGVLFVIERD